MYENELTHHGVKGMKWGVRKAKVEKIGSHLKRISNNLDSRVDRGGLTTKTKAPKSAIMDRGGFSTRTKAPKRTLNTKSGATYVVKRFLEKNAARQEYKNYIKAKRKEINAGESFVGRMWNKLTDADKYQAQIAYDIEKRARR